MDEPKPNYDHPARSIATELVVRIMLEMMERSDPALRGEILRQATARAEAMTRDMPSAVGSRRRWPRSSGRMPKWRGPGGFNGIRSDLSADAARSARKDDNRSMPQQNRHIGCVQP